MRLASLGPALLPLLAAWVLSSRVGGSLLGKALAAAADALALVATALLWNAGLGRSGVLDSDPLSLFLAAFVLAAVAFAAVSPRQDVESLCRLHLGGSLSIVSVSTRELLWSVPAILLFGMVMRQSKAPLVGLLIPSFVAFAGLFLVEASGALGLGFILLAAGLSAVWVVVSRDVLRSSPSGLVTRMAATFAHLVAISSVLMRIAAWLPESAPLETIHALALVALALGAFGALASTRITTFLTALALGRAGLVLFAHLGGVHGRAPLLLELAASGFSLLLVAVALDRAATLDDVSTLTSVPGRLILTLGALSACSFPPFPGFVAAFPLSSVLLDQGYSFSLLLVCTLLFLLGVGSMRLVVRAWESGKTRTAESAPGIAAILLAVAAAWFLGVAPARLVEMATAAALSMF